MVTKEPFFSVIMPSYNRAFCICTAIDSLLSQTYKNYEFIVVDDGSSDETHEILQNKYAEQFACGKFRYTRHENNMGLNAARNTGLDLSKNDWIVYLDDDNTLFPDYLESSAKAIEDNPDYKVFYSQREVNGYTFGHKNDYTKLINDNRLGLDMGVVVCHRDIFNTYGRFDVNLKRRTDYDFFLRVLRFEKAFWIPKALMYYNTGEHARICNTESYEAATDIIYGKMAQVYYPFFESVKKISSIYIFMDKGNGFNEYDSEVFYSFPISINIGNEVQAIKIKPSSHFCILNNISIIVNDKTVEYTTNSNYQDQTVFYFNTDSPEIYISPVEKGEYQINMQVYDVDKIIAAKINWLKNSYFNMKEELNILKSEKLVQLTKEMEKIKVDNARLTKESDKFKVDNARLTKESDKFKVDNARLTKESDKFKMENARLTEERDKFKRDSTRLTEEVKKSKSENANLKNSISYKVGRLITFVPRKLRGLLRMLKKRH